MGTEEAKQEQEVKKEKEESSWRAIPLESAREPPPPTTADCRVRLEEARGRKAAAIEE